MATPDLNRSISDTYRSVTTASKRSEAVFGAAVQQRSTFGELGAAVAAAAFMAASAAMT